jgi:hypothetical protein
MSGHRTIVNATKNATATAGRSKSSTTPWNLQALPQVADVRCVATIIFGLSCQHRSEGKQRSRQKRDGAVCPSEKFIATRFPGTRGPEDCCWSEWRNCSFIGAPVMGQRRPVLCPTIAQASTNIRPDRLGTNLSLPHTVCLTPNLLPHRPPTSDKLSTMP